MLEHAIHGSCGVNRLPTESSSESGMEDIPVVLQQFVDALDVCNKVLIVFVQIFGKAVLLPCHTNRGSTLQFCNYSHCECGM